MPKILPRQILTPTEAAELLPISLSTLYKKIKSGQVAVYKLGPDVFYLDPLALRTAFGPAFKYSAPRGYEQV